MAFLADQLKRIKPSATIAVTDKARALKLAGRNVIGLGAASRISIRPTISRSGGGRDRERQGLKYTTVDGIPELKDAVVAQVQARERAGL